MADLNTQFPAWLAQKDWWGERNRSGQEFLQGAQLGSNIAARQREMDYRNRALQLEQDAFNLKRETLLQNNEGTIALGKTLSEIAATGDWTSPESEAKFWSTVTRYPVVTQSSNFDNIAGIFERAKHAKLQLDLAQSRADRGFAPSNIRKLVEEGYLTEEQARTLAPESILGPTETTRIGTDEFGRPTYTVEKGVRQKGVEGGPTVAVKTDLQKDINNTRHSLSMMGKLQQNLRAKDVGFYGVIGETVMDRFLPQFGLGTADLQRTDNRTKLKTLVQGMLRQISPDNRFTENDFKRVADIMPDIGVLENVERAKQILAELTNIFAERNVRDMRALGEPLDMAKMDLAEIVAAVKMGMLDREAARNFIRNAP